MIGARSARDGFVLSTATERPCVERGAHVAEHARLPVAGVREEILADEHVRAAEPCVVERRLARAGEADEDGALDGHDAILAKPSPACVNMETIYLARPPVSSLDG